MIQRNIGMVFRDQRDYAQAAEHFRESMRLARLISGHQLGYSLARGLCHDFAAAWSAGHAFSRERAIGFALEQVQSSS